MLPFKGIQSWVKATQKGEKLKEGCDVTGHRTRDLAHQRPRTKNLCYPCSIGPVSHKSFEKFHVSRYYKTIFTSRKSHLLIKGAKNQNTVIMDLNSHFIWRSLLLPASPLIKMSVGWSKRALRSSRECGKLFFLGILHSNWNSISAPDAISFYPSNWSLRGKRRSVFLVALPLFSHWARARVLEISLFALTKPAPAMQSIATVTSEPFR